MKKVLFSISLGLTAISHAQNYLHQALILNEGKFDYVTKTIVEPVTIGSYNPKTDNYYVVDTLEGMRFASDLIIDGNYYYVAADTMIFKFDLNSHKELSNVSCSGVRNLAVYQNKLVATRGEYQTTYDSYLHVYDASNLNLIKTIDTVQGPKWASQNIIIDGKTAYIAVNNGYEWGKEKGIIGKLDLSDLTYGNEIDLGPDGKNPDNLVKYGSHLYSVNNKNWSGASVSKISLNGTLHSTANIASASTGCGTSALRDDKLVYQISGEQVLNEYDIYVMNNVGPVIGHSKNYYELAQEPVSGNFYCSETDYSTYGEVHIFDKYNTELASFSVGISPGTIAFDVRPIASTMELNQQIFCYPNPTTNELSVPNNGKKRIYDFSGKLLIESSENLINVSELKQGIYFLECNGSQTTFSKN